LGLAVGERSLSRQKNKKGEDGEKKRKREVRKGKEKQRDRRDRGERNDEGWDIGRKKSREGHEERGRNKR